MKRKWIGMIISRIRPTSSITIWNFPTNPSPDRVTLPIHYSSQEKRGPFLQSWGVGYWRTFTQTHLIFFSWELYLILLNDEKGWKVCGYCVGTLNPLAITRHCWSQLTRRYPIPSCLKTLDTAESDWDIISIAPCPNPNFQQGSRLEQSTISASQGKTTSFNRLQREQVSFKYPFTKGKYGFWDAEDGVLV
jgi:hypothetical protein